MYLLKMASNQQPAADDLVPVLIYVIIKVSFELNLKRVDEPTILTLMYSRQIHSIFKAQ